MSSQLTAEEVLTTLISGRGSDKQAAIDTIEALPESLDVDRLRTLLFHELTNRFIAPAPGQAEDIRTRDARGWLLAALGRVAADDAQSSEVVRKHLDPDAEPYYWARYWALVGLYAGQANDLADLADQVHKRRDDPLVHYLASAVLAAKGNNSQLTAIEEALSNTEDGECWAALRALRIVPLPSPRIVSLMCSIVREGSFSDITYDAIVALGKIPPEAPQAREAAAALGEYVGRYRWPMYDSMRTNALIGLGQLHDERSAPALLEELVDDSPSIVFHASQALEDCLGTRIATSRIVEAATDASAPEVPKLASALRPMDRQEVLNELETAMATGPSAQREAARRLLAEIGGAQAFDKLHALTETTKQYASDQSAADKRLDSTLEKVLDESKSGFYLAIGMDITIFLAGIAILCLGVYLGVTGGEAFERITGAITAAGGISSTILGKYLVSSRNRIEPSVRQLASLKAIFHGYLRGLRQLDQAYTRRLLEDSPLSANEVREFAEILERSIQLATKHLTAVGSDIGLDSNLEKDSPPTTEEG